MTTDHMTSLSISWLGPLTGMIEQINTRFSQFFKEMNCMGEVGLLQHENVRNTLLLWLLWLLGLQ